jgi:hypothetical protein
MESRTSCILLKAVVTLFLLWSVPVATAQLNEDCTVSVLNRTVQVNADGSWVLPNIPANFGQVKARATCVRNGVTVSGESDFFTILSNRMNAIAPIILGKSTQIPSSLILLPANASFTAANETIQLTVTATYPDNSTKDVSAAATGTNYTSSNPSIATVDANGLLTAVASGTVVIQASNDGATGIIRASVVLSNVDSDGDGIPDDVEVTLGLNPHNLVDAQEDFDRDGLTNLKEFELGTGLRVFDTDGDGIGDGLEVQTGSNPLDPNSFNLAQLLRSIKVAPTNFALLVNTIIGVASQQLTVTGTLIDGNSINLTARSRGTNYNSSNLNVANFGAVDGMVFAGADGNATITVTNNGHTAMAQVTVSSFSPIALSFISIPGFANNVDLSGNFAYVAAGSTGLQVVDVTDRRAPRIVGSLDTPGNANDVRVVGHRAYVADGAAGLRVIDITNPASPVLLGSLDTPGVANDVVVVGDRAYVADGSAGLQIIDVNDPVVPRLLGTFDTPGTAKGVDVSGGIAVIADGSSLLTVDISNPANPIGRGSVTTADARDVTVEGAIAYLADFSGSFKTIDFSTPTAPRLLATTPQALGGILTDVAKVREFVFGADVFFVNGVPIVNVDDPANLSVRARLDFPARDDNGTGIAVDNQFVYLTADRSLQENGVTGDSRLYIGQYVSLEDRAGIPPVVSISSPSAGATVIEGATLPITVQATDDVQVVSVDLLVNGNVVFTDSAAPYQFNLIVPNNVTSLTLSATAVDLAGNVGTAADVPVNVIPDPLTTVIGRVVDGNQNPVAGATVTTLQRSATTGADGSFTINNVPTIAGLIVVSASATVDSILLSGNSAAISPAASAITNVGDIVIVPRRRVAVFGAPSTGSWNTDVRNKLQSTGVFTRVDEFLVSSSAPVPTLAQLQQYDAVLVYSDLAFNNNVALGNVLADYLDSGGGVVLATFAFYSAGGLDIQGRIKTGNYLPFTTAGQQQPGNLTLVPVQPQHPILEGVTSFHGGSSSFHNSPITTASGATLVANWSNGQPLVATKVFTAGRIAGLNFYPPSSDARADFWRSNTDGARLMANALIWAASRQ